MKQLSFRGNRNLGRRSFVLTFESPEPVITTLILIRGYFQCEQRTKVVDRQIPILPNHPSTLYNCIDLHLRRPGLRRLFQQNSNAWIRNTLMVFVTLEGATKIRKRAHPISVGGETIRKTRLLVLHESIKCFIRVRHIPIVLCHIWIGKRDITQLCAQDQVLRSA